VGSQRKTRALAGWHEITHPRDHKTARRKGRAFGVEWRQPARDLVGVDELADAQVARDHGRCRRRFSAPLGPPMMTISFNRRSLFAKKCSELNNIDGKRQVYEKI